MTKIRYTMFVVAVFFALLLSAINTAPAFADESTPPDEGMATEEAPPAEEDEANGMVSEVPPAPAEEVEVVQETAEEQSGSFAEEQTEPAVEEEVLVSNEIPASEAQEPILEQLPENTELVILDENGEPLPLASQEAAEILAVSDPQWCPNKVAPGSPGCSGVKSSFNGGDPLDNLIEWLKQNQPSVAGVIWIESGYVGDVGLEGGPVVLNGLDFTSMDNFALTINGGWTGSGITLDPYAPSTFNVPFSIINWNAPVTINNILVNAANGAGTAALEVITKGNIIINNVDVMDNVTENGGALLDNTTGTGTVTVNESSFNGNIQGDGLRIYSKSSVTLTNVGAINNGLTGVYIDNSTAPYVLGVTLNGFNNFSYNGSDGLNIKSRGVVTLTNIVAVFNAEGSGALVKNDYGSPSAVNLKGVNTFNNNGWDGLRIYSTGIVSLNSVTVNNNGTDPNRPSATYLDPGDDETQGTPDDIYDNDGYGKGLAVFNWSALPKAVNLTGTNMFNQNASNGLYIDANGLVKLNNLTANYNGCDPAYDMDADFCAGAYVQGGGVTLIGYGNFIGNEAQGFEVYNAFVPSMGTNVGAIVLANLYATDNGDDGVLAVTSGNISYGVSIAGNNFFHENQGYGLFVWSNGTVSLSNLTATKNAAGGVLVDNTSAKSAQSVSIIGSNIFNENGAAGLYVSSNGAITTNNITAIYNDGQGAFLDNCGWDWSLGLIGECTGLRPDGGVMASQAVSMNGTNNTSWNEIDGTMIVSLGAIKFSNLVSNWNTNLGGYFYNAFNPAVSANVSQAGYATFLNNVGLSGFNIYSMGAVSLSNVTANDNQTFGGVIQNNTANKIVDVYLNGVNIFNGNGMSGLSVTTKGLVILNNVTAVENGFGGVFDQDLNWVPYPGPHYGVVVNNAGGASPRAVYLNGINTFHYNNGTGLSVNSRGEIKVSKLTANFNEGSGVFLNNQYNASSVPVTVLGFGIFNNNAGIGLAVSSNGLITTNNLTALNNGDDGVNLTNDSMTTTPSSISMLGANTFNDNATYGLFIETDGAVTLYNITANGNADWGAWLDNVTLGSLTAPRGMTLYGTNNFIGNAFGGLYFNSTGAVLLNRVTAGLNDDGVGGAPASSGIEGYSASNIAFACGYTFLNEGYGYYFDAAKYVTLSGVSNYGSPVFIDGLVVIKTRPCKLP